MGTVQTTASVADIDKIAGLQSTASEIDATVNTLGTKVDKVTSTDNAVPRFNGTSGDLQDSGVTISDDGDINTSVSGISHKLSEKVSSDVAYSYVSGLEQKLLANDGQSALNILAVGFALSGKVQGVSLGDGNVVEVYASGDDFTNGTVLYREFMDKGEPIVFSGLSNGAIITSTQGFYGFSEVARGDDYALMPLMTVGLSFKKSFFYAFRGSSVFLDDSNTARDVKNAGTVCVVNCGVPNTIKMTDGDGVTVQGQENITLKPWEFKILGTDGNKEYIVDGTENLMALTFANDTFYDAKLMMPLTNDGITWGRSSQISALYDNTEVKWYVRDGVCWHSQDKNIIVASPGSPQSASSNGVDAGEGAYQANGAIRYKAKGLIASFSGADNAGGDATPMMPISAMSNVVAQPLFIEDTSTGASSGIAIASPYKGTAKIYSWDDTTKSLVLEYTIPLTRNIGSATTKDDQNFPCAAQLSNDDAADVTLDGNLKAGIIIADVPISVIVQNADGTYTPTIRSQNGTTDSAIQTKEDETLCLGITPDTLRPEIKEDTDGLLRLSKIDNSGSETWELV